MLTSIRIKNWRSCADTTIEELKSIVALIGRNGAGKSNILQAVAFAASAASSVTPQHLPSLVSAATAGPLSFVLEFICDSVSYKYTLHFGITLQKTEVPKTLYRESLHRKRADEIETVVDRIDSDVQIEGRTEKVAIGRFVSSLPTLVAILSSNDPVVAELKKVMGFLSTIRYYAIDEPAKSGRSTQMVLDSGYRSWLATYETSGDPGDSVLYRLIYMFEKRKDDFQVVEALLGRNGLGLIDGIHVNRQVATGVPPSGPTGPSTGVGGEEIFRFVTFNPIRGRDIPPIAVYADALSAGTRRVLKMVVSMIFDRSAVMLLEQPEDSLHQGLTKKLIDLVQTNTDSQLIMASHSSALLSELKPEQIRLVYLHDGFTIARSLTPEECKIAQDFMNEKGSLYDFLETVQEQ